MFCRSLFFLLSCFLWPLYCLSFDIRILIAPLVSSNFSYSKNPSYAPTYISTLVFDIYKSFIVFHSRVVTQPQKRCVSLSSFTTLKFPSLCPLERYYMTQFLDILQRMNLIESWQDMTGQVMQSRPSFKKTHTTLLSVNSAYWPFLLT